MALNNLLKEKLISGNPPFMRYPEKAFLIFARDLEE